MTPRIEHVPQVAAARQASPSSGNQHVGAARALTEELPCILDALRTGLIEEWTATRVVQATTCLTREDRAGVDAALAVVFTRDGIAGGQIEREAKALAQQADPAAAVARARKAESQRCVSLRPAPDTMAYVTALLPMVTAVAAHASLLEAVKEHAATRVEGDDRGRGAVMADTFAERLTGRVVHLETQPVVVHLVMDTDTLLDAGDVSASIPGHGPVPASIARELLATAAEAGQAWVRRLYTAPDSSQLVAVESKQRAFPAGLGLFLTARDQRCATPYCDAPIATSTTSPPTPGVARPVPRTGKGCASGATTPRNSPGSAPAETPTPRSPH